MSSILIIEDERAFAQNIKLYLEFEKYSVSVAFDGEDGLHKALDGNYALIILDLNLPKLDGLKVCSNLREQNSNVPILMLTARTGQKNIVEGLNSGADDYLTKPFDLEVLSARVSALLRRVSETKKPIITLNNIIINTNSHIVTWDKQVISLAPKEYALLEFLARNKGVVKDRSEIIELVWGEYDDLMFSQTVDVHVAYLRKKLGKTIIKTVPGKGYLISE
jgi:DNA-binding response OmpR family regulator